jgi:hypothetical protein
MRKAVAKAIVDAGQDIGLEVELYEGYSGRGMYGDSTDAVTFDNWSDFVQSVAAAAIRLSEDHDETAEKSDDNIDPDMFVHDLGAIRTDNMGRGVIVY